MTYRARLDALIEQARFQDRIAREAVREEGAAALAEMFAAHDREQREAMAGSTGDAEAQRRRLDEERDRIRRNELASKHLFGDELTEAERAELDALGGLVDDPSRGRAAGA